LSRSKNPFNPFRSALKNPGSGFLGAPNRSVSIGASGDLSAAVEGHISPIGFGTPSQTAEKTTSSDSAWSILLQRTNSRSSSSLLSEVGLGSISGIGSVLGAFSKLIAGDATKPAPLQRFSLPSPQHSTLYAGSHETTIYGADMFAASGTGSISGSESQIVQAVKSALLHSSSLNDVIAEI
jgi:hypothetical protein